MGSIKGRPLIIVPPGLKELFMREACPEGAIMFAEVREVDPTHPGLPEFEELIGGAIDDELPAAPEPQPEKGKAGSVLRLIVLNGRRLER